MENFNFTNMWFDLVFYFCILNGCLAFLELFFFGRFVDQILKWYQYMGYIMMMYLIYWAEIKMRVSFPTATALESIALFGFGCLILKCSPILSALTTILTITIMQVVNGIFHSFSNIICTTFPQVKYVSIFFPISGLLAIATAFLTYQYVLKLFYVKKAPMIQYVLILLFPILFVLFVVQYIFNSYGNNIGLITNEHMLLPRVYDWEMLLIQIMAYVCLMAVVFAYSKLSEAFALQMQNALLEQQINAQKNYMQEIQTRYEQTRSFRHDIKNHWTILNGLLKREETQKALNYLNKLEHTSETFSFPCQTGNTAIDMLFSNKLGVALQRGIRVDCTVKIPHDCTIDEMDLCIVFSNAVDNALKACNSVSGAEKYMTLSTVRKGKFLMIEIKNSQSNNDYQKKGFGIGLNNIKTVAEKYNGVVNIESDSNFFYLNILFVLPLHCDSI